MIIKEPRPPAVRLAYGPVPASTHPSGQDGKAGGWHLVDVDDAELFQPDYEGPAPWNEDIDVFDVAKAREWAAGVLDRVGGDFQVDPERWTLAEDGTHVPALKRRRHYLFLYTGDARHDVEPATEWHALGLLADLHVRDAVLRFDTVEDRAVDAVKDQTYVPVREVLAARHILRLEDVEQV